MGAFILSTLMTSSRFLKNTDPLFLSISEKVKAEFHHWCLLCIINLTLFIRFLKNKKNVGDTAVSDSMIKATRFFSHCRCARFAASAVFQWREPRASWPVSCCRENKKVWKRGFQKKILNILSHKAVGAVCVATYWPSWEHFQDFSKLGCVEMNEFLSESEVLPST